MQKWARDAQAGALARRADMRMPWSCADDAVVRFYVCPWTQSVLPRLPPPRQPSQLQCASSQGGREGQGVVVVSDDTCR
jgi:hypothetical protein